MDITFDKGPSGRIRGLRERLAGMTQDDVLLALQNFSQAAAQDLGYGESTDYDLIHDERAYPPKAIFGLAAQRIAGRPLTSDEFSGGDRSPCFLILGSLGFEVIKKGPAAQSEPPLASLARGSVYDRQDISQIFEPGSKFTRGAGRWGIPGIVEVPPQSGNFVFMVTLGEPNEANPYQDALTADGYLIWESQTRHTLESPAIQKMLSHDSEQNSIHLFLRGSAGSGYTYFGLLEYFSHDLKLSEPVHFIWRILNWDFDISSLKSMGIAVRAAIDPTYSPVSKIQPIGVLVQVEPPQLGGNSAPTGRKPRKVAGTSKNIDWATRDARNRQLGLEGEKLILQHEINHLKDAGRADLADQVKHVALVNAAAGYDIASFTPDGTLKRIEVKTTQGPKTAQFFISINEIITSRDDPATYWVYRVFNFKPDSGAAEFFVMNGDVEDRCELMPVNFRARPGR